MFRLITAVSYNVMIIIILCQFESLKYALLHKFS